MNCEKCQKKKASYHLTAIEGGKKKEAHLCEACAKTAGVGASVNFSIGELLKSSKGEGKDKKQSEKACRCGMTKSKYHKIGRLGCPECYDFFKDEVLEAVKRCQASERHIGKKPEGYKEDEAEKRRIELATLDKELKEAIKQENYELAAQIRDRAKALGETAVARPEKEEK